MDNVYRWYVYGSSRNYGIKSVLNHIHPSHQVDGVYVYMDVYISI